MDNLNLLKFWPKTTIKELQVDRNVSTCLYSGGNVSKGVEVSKDTYKTGRESPTGSSFTKRY